MTNMFGRAPLRKTASHFSGTRSAMFGRALSAPIHFYRRFLSPLKPPSCRFEPTCSAYALEAIKSHGPLKGLALALKRLLRCHPITWLGGASGFDPVPHSKHRSS
jgi:putative membrane protein insertion efficiency factor